MPGYLCFSACTIFAGSTNMKPVQFLFFSICTFLMVSISSLFGQQGDLELSYSIDPFTRLVHVSYAVPENAPDTIQVTVDALNNGDDEWGVARIQKFRSVTGRRLCPQQDWDLGMLQGTVEEFNAAGFRRTFIWYPYPEYEPSGRIAATLRINLYSEAGELAHDEITIVQDNSDVYYIEDWSDVIQERYVSESPQPGEKVWWFHTGITGGNAPVSGRMLEAGEKGMELPQLTKRLNLRGKYAIYVCLPPPLSAIEIRLSGDERSQFFDSRRYREEQFYRITSLDYQNIVLSQPYRTVYEFEEGYRARIDYIKLVPLKTEFSDLYDERIKGERDKIVIGYNEPYSWAFHENVQSNIQHREPLSAFRDAQVDIIDIQISRLGMRPVFETRNEEPLYWGTRGDPVRGAVPETFNVGRMQQYTNMLGTQLVYSREFGMKPFANIGAGNSYPGSPLQGEFAAAHPDWHQGAQLSYDIPEVRRHLLDFYREALEIGAPGISIDFCRYPYGAMSAEICTNFLRDLRKIADLHSSGDSNRVQILVRFPAHGVRRSEWFDYETWCRENIVDFLCPSNIQGRHMNFNIVPYVKAVQESMVKLCPVVDALSWGLAQPGEFLLRVRDIYRAGAHGVYIYQCDSPVLEGERTREMVRICGSTEALERFFTADSARRQNYSTDIYLKPPTEGFAYNPWERIRFWIDGIQPDKIVVLLDDTEINRFENPPYWVGSEDYESDTLLSGEHSLVLRAIYGNRTFEKAFAIEGE